MTCETVKLPGGGAAIVCSRSRPRRCCACFLVGGFQCDWKVSPTKTCDRYICPEHAKEVAPQKHLCPEHQEAYKVWLAKRGGGESDEQRSEDADVGHALGLDWKGG